MNGIKALRQRLGLSRTELAKKLGVHFNAIGNWERGEGSPRIATGWRLVRLCRAARVNVRLEHVYPESNYNN